MTMTTTIDNSSTTLPTKTADMSWDVFTQEIVDAYGAEEERLTEAFPTPAMSAEPGSDDWSSQWLAQRRAADERSSHLMSYASKLILQIGKALAAAVPNFRSLDVEYEGCGDSGEGCSISVFVDRLRKVDAEGKFVRWTDEENEAFRQQNEAANNILPSYLKAWMDETCWAIAYNQHPGFEINAGGYGQIVVAPADEDEEGSPLQLTISHTQRTEECYEDVLA